MGLLSADCQGYRSLESARCVICHDAKVLEFRVFVAWEATIGSRLRCGAFGFAGLVGEGYGSGETGVGYVYV